MAAKTRLSEFGYGTRRIRSFAGKRQHPVGKITRLSASAYGTRRCGSFAGKGGVTPSAGLDEYIIRARRRTRR